MSVTTVKQHTLRCDHWDNTDGICHEVFHGQPGESKRKVRQRAHEQFSWTEVGQIEADGEHIYDYCPRHNRDTEEEAYRAARERIADVVGAPQPPVGVRASGKALLRAIESTEQGRLLLRHQPD